MSSKGKKHVITKAQLQNRPLTLLEKTENFFNSDSVLIFFPTLLFIYFINPFFFLLLFPLGFYFIKDRETRHPKMPFFFPASSGVKFDPFNPNPAKKKDGTKIYREAQGIVYFGNETENNLQCWFDNGTVRQHVSFLAATGSGKTFTMIGIFNVNSLIFGAGYCLVDGKADLDLAHKEISLLHRFNRLDDLFLVNYIQGDTNPWDEYDGHITTNTFNILDTGTAQSCIESFKSLMTSDNDIWAKRADALIAALLGPLVFLRDERVQFLNMGTMLDYLTVESAGLLASPEPVEQFNFVKIPEQVSKQLYGFIKTLPGVSAGDFKTLLKGESVKSTQVYDQWGFCSMQVILVVNMLAGDYTKIFGCESGDINQDAIVLTDRILLALLPALEASPQSVASMGRIVLSSRKAMMGRSLGHQIEGEAARNIESRPTNSAYPYINVMDEVGMYFDLSEGPASAQSRSLGFSLAYLAQDLPAMGKLSEEVAKTVETVMGNTIIKVCGRIIDEKTRELYQKLAGEHFVWQRDRADIGADGMSTKSSDTSASYVKESRLDEHEIQELREGELFITAIDKLYRVDGPTMVPKNMKQLALNHFVPWQPYDRDTIVKYKLAKLEMKEIYHRVTTTDVETEFDVDSVGELMNILQRVDMCRPNTRNITEAFAYGFASYATMQSDLLSSISGLYDALDEVREDEVIGEPDSIKGEDCGETTKVDSEEITDVSSEDSEHENQTNDLADPEAISDEYESAATEVEIESHSEASEEEVSTYLNDVTHNTSPGYTNSSENAYLDASYSEEDNTEPKIHSLNEDIEYSDVPSLANSATLGDSKREKYASIFNKSLEHNGMSREEVSEEMSLLAAKANKLSRLSNDIDKGLVSTQEANETLNKEITKDELQVATEQVEEMLVKVDSSVIHPKLPSPTTNVDRTLKILGKLHDLLKD